MKNLNPYLNFPGNCEEALNFYKDALGGEITTMMTFGQSPISVPEEQQNKVMHSEFKADGIHFMACDGLGEHAPKIGNNISMSLNFTDEAEQEAVFTRLSIGGTITMSLEDTFWGAKFGMLIDKYGINWMLNYQKNN